MCLLQSFAFSLVMIRKYECEEKKSKLLSYLRPSNKSFKNFTRKYFHPHHPQIGSELNNVRMSNGEVCQFI